MADHTVVLRLNKQQLELLDRTIQRGEELTVNYNFDKDVRTFPCTCGAPDCGGTIGNTKK